MFKHKAKGTRANNTLIPSRGLDLGAANKKVVSSKSQSGEASHFLEAFLDGIIVGPRPRWLGCNEADAAGDAKGRRAHNRRRSAGGCELRAGAAPGAPSCSGATPGGLRVRLRPIHAALRARDGCT